MGLFDSLKTTLGTSLGASLGGNAGGLLPIVMAQLANYPGGMDGLIAAFERGGLGAIVQSWIGKGENLPVTGGQLDAVLDPGVVDAMAAQSGQSRPALLDALAGLLPGLVDKATPNGTAADLQSFDASSLLGMLAKLGK
ncbi:YidB family protein [Orrella sp. JC864]|uniref:YidB family protein n=1 Tax=Orrella sp. JC864 TaxID=3120298 RepID=UPI0030083D61